ncbi:hypothetical protein ACHAXT_008391 [Thalassiosira profunda]
MLSSILRTSSTAVLRHTAQPHHCLPSLYFAATRLRSTAPSASNAKPKQHLVLALGGNALLKRGEALSISNQRKNIADGIASLSDILRNNKILLVHGNGPQVGLLALQGAAYKKETGASEALNLDVLDAETEGQIGYLLEQEIDAVLGREGRKRGVATLLSQIVVDPNDPAFDDPTKFIGPVYTEKEAKELGKPVKPDGKYWRQVVASPKPLRLIDQQLEAVKLLVENNCICICAGGGGIPVIEHPTKNRLEGVDAVIDKDRAACMLGKTLGADGLMILTDVPGVAVNYGKPDEKYIRSVSPDRLLELAASTNADGSKTFPDGSMGPKVESAVDFVQHYPTHSCWSTIGSLKNAGAGTLITNKYGADHLEYYSDDCHSDDIPA